MKVASAEPVEDPSRIERGPQRRSNRIVSVDLLRGAVLIVMALDHIRDCFSNAQTFSPTDPTRTWPALFFTRWITHFCAPVFVLLAGMGAALQLVGGKTRKELSWFLVTRGLWLIVVELTWVQFTFMHFFVADVVFLQVIWAIGISMVVLAGLLWLPTAAVGAIGCVLMAGHNLLGETLMRSAGAPSIVWQALELGGRVQITSGMAVRFLYPLLAWIGVMAAGFALGSLFRREARSRRRWLLGFGGGATLLFVLLRGIDRYGDPSPWTHQKNALFTLLSFLNCEKYPPSLDYLLMTLGPALLALALLDTAQVRSENPVLVFGRVPLFYYMLHFPLIMLCALSAYGVEYGTRVLHFGALNHLPDGAGWSLPVVYAIWIVVVCALYRPCRYWANLKRRKPHWAWLSYL